jgi:cation transport regulator ChaC
MASQIHQSAGPSGRNIDYLLELADALRALQAEDDHVYELEAAVRKIAQ